VQSTVARVEHPACGNDSARGTRSSWTRLVKKGYEADPLLCRRCVRPLKIVSLIDAPSVIERILRHLKVWDRPERPPPTPRPRTLHYDLEIPAWEDDIESFDPTR
jgi:hypothetical protein